MTARELDLGALCSLTAAVPAGPWRAVGTEVYGPSPDCLWIADTGDAGAEDGGRAVAELIAAARAALPGLVAEEPPADDDWPTTAAPGGGQQ